MGSGFSRLSGEAQNEYVAGKTAQFGCIGVTQAGITLSGQTLAWSDLQSFDISGTEVYFRKKQKWLAWKKCELGDVANYEVFKHLANRIQSGTI